MLTFGACCPQYSWEYFFVVWAESKGIVLDYAVNSDLEPGSPGLGPELVEEYKLVLSVGHDEYPLLR